MEDTKDGNAKVWLNLNIGSTSLPLETLIRNQDLPLQKILHLMLEPFLLGISSNPSQTFVIIGFYV